MGCEETIRNVLNSEFHIWLNQSCDSELSAAKRLIQQKTSFPEVSHKRTPGPLATVTMLGGKSGQYTINLVEISSDVI